MTSKKCSSTVHTHKKPPLNDTDSSSSQSASPNLKPNTNSAVSASPAPEIPSVAASSDLSAYEAGEIINPANAKTPVNLLSQALMLNTSNSSTLIDALSTMSTAQAQNPMAAQLNALLLATKQEPVSQHGYLNAMFGNQFSTTDDIFRLASLNAQQKQYSSPQNSPLDLLSLLQLQQQQHQQLNYAGLFGQQANPGMQLWLNYMKNTLNFLNVNPATPTTTLTTNPDVVVTAAKKRKTPKADSMAAKKTKKTADVCANRGTESPASSTSSENHLASTVNSEPLDLSFKKESRYIIITD